MTESVAGTLTPTQVASPFRPVYAAAALIAIAVMIAAIVADNLFLLTFIHIMAGLMWTGIDLFMGLVVGPILRQLDLEARRPFIMRLMPKMLFLMPTLAIVTGTAGWYLAEARGYTALDYPEFGWILAALVIVAVLAVQGLGILLPTNLRVLLELQKPAPDLAKIGRLMRLYVRVVASQAIMQIVIIVVMARIATGF